MFEATDQFHGRAICTGPDGCTGGCVNRTPKALVAAGVLIFVALWAALVLIGSR